MALVREADAERNLRQADLAVSPQEVLRSFNAARNHILVRRQPGGRLELPREVCRRRGLVTSPPRGPGRRHR
jgi:hypothetical protein